jgi:hypothetical protein
VSLSVTKIMPSWSARPDGLLRPALAPSTRTSPATRPNPASASPPPERCSGNERAAFGRHFFLG